MRSYIDKLNARGELLVVDREVDPKYELAAVVENAQRSARKPILFNKVRGSQFPVVSNVFGDNVRLCELIGAQPGRFCARWTEIMDRSTTMTPFARVEANPQPLVESSLQSLPQIIWREKDSGPYLTAAVFYACDPETGVGNLSFCRTLIDGDEVTCCIDPPHDLAQYAAKAEALGRALDIAILIGPPPEVFLAACASIPIDRDEMQVAAAIRQEPIPVQQAKTVELTFPSETQIVLEGRIRPSERRSEGPFGEFMGYYGSVNPDGYIIDVTRVAHQPNAIFHGLLCGSAEDLAVLDVAFAARTYAVLASTIEGVLDVTCNPMFFCSIVKIEKRSEEQVRQIIDTVFDANKNYNFVCIVVDKDVDIRDMAAVFHAFITRGRVDRRVTLLDGVPGFDRSPDPLYAGRLGIDATMPLGRESEFERTRTPGSDQIDLAHYLRPTPGL